MDDRIRQAVGSEPAWVVGGALRDELLGREVVDVDVACADPELAARLYARLAGGAVFPLSERHGAWRVAFRAGSTVDFTPLHGETIEDDLATRDFTVNAMARPLEGGDLVDPLGGEADLAASRLRAVTASIFDDDPLRLLRAVRLEDELGFLLDEETEKLVRDSAERAVDPAGERILGELERMSPDGLRRAGDLGPSRPARRRARRSRARRSRRHARLRPRRRLRRAAPAPPDLERAAPPRPHAPRSRAAGRRLSARDPPLPQADRAVVAHGARLPRRDRSLRRRARSPRFGAARAAAPGRGRPRARRRAGPGDRPPARARRRGARRRHDLDEGRGARARLPRANRRAQVTLCYLGWVSAT